MAVTAKDSGETDVLKEMISHVPTRLTAEISDVSGNTVTFMYPANTKIITWGDGTIDFFDELWESSLNITHQYAEYGTYTINIYGATEIPAFFAALFPPINPNKWMTEIYMSDEITSIGSDAFYNASVLNKCVLSNSISALSYPYIFYGTHNLLEITIPENITSIHAMGETYFQKVIFSHTTPPSITNLMSNTPFGASAKPIIPSEDLKDAYNQAWGITVYWHTLSS